MRKKVVHLNWFYLQELVSRLLKIPITFSMHCKVRRQVELESRHLILLMNGNLK
jgi:hypothetical protein